MGRALALRSTWQAKGFTSAFARNEGAISCSPFEIRYFFSIGIWISVSQSDSGVPFQMPSM